MELLIDGYNLLHATDLFGAGAAEGTLEGSREALLAFLAGVLSESERRRTTIVFDSADALPGLPDSYGLAGISVHFARNYPDADAMLEALIEGRPRGKGLTVVSSDHRVQRAARRHGAHWVGSTEWYRELRSRRASEPESFSKPSDPTLGDVAYWIEKFADQKTLQAIEEDQRQASLAPLPPSPPSNTAPSHKPRASKKREQPFGEGIFEVFPPGYADDLAEQLEKSPDDADSP